jgi:fumarate hydratase class II
VKRSRWLQSKCFVYDHAVAFAGSQGNFQLNVYKPVMLHNTLTSIELLADASRSCCERCAIGIEPNATRIKEHLENSLMLVASIHTLDMGRRQKIASAICWITNCQICLERH